MLVIYGGEQGDKIKRYVFNKMLYLLRNLPTTMTPKPEHKTRTIRAMHVYRQARKIHSKVRPLLLSDKTPNTGPPSAPPMSNNVDSKPDWKGEYPRESLRYRGSQRYKAKIKKEIYYNLNIDARGIIFMFCP